MFHSLRRDVSINWMAKWFGVNLEFNFLKQIVFYLKEIYYFYENIL